MSATPPGRMRRFLAGLQYGYLNQVLTALVGLWLTPFLLKGIGSHDYGLWVVGTSVMAYLTLLDLGLVALLTRETAYATGRAGGWKQAHDLPGIVGQTTRLTLWQMPLVAVMALGVWFVIPFAMPKSGAELLGPLGLVLLGFVILFPLRAPQAVLLGLQDMGFLGATQTLAWLLGTALTVTLVFNGWGLYSLAIGWLATLAIVATACVCRLATHYPGILPRRLPSVSWPHARVQLGQGAWVSVAQIAQVLLNGTEYVLIGRLFGPVAVVSYACTAKLLNLLSNQPQMIMQFAGPALSEVRASNDRGRLPQIATALTQGMLAFSGAVICVALAVNQGFVRWWVPTEQYGEQYGGESLTWLLALNMLLRHWNTTAVYSIFCFGYERHISIVMLLDGLVTLCASVGLLWWLGPIGAPLGSLAGVCLVSLPCNVSAWSRETEVSMRQILASLWPWFWRFSLIAAVAIWMSNAWMPQSLPTLVLTTLLVSLLYAALVFPALCRSELGKMMIPRMISLWPRTNRFFVSCNVKIHHKSVP